MKQVRTNVSTSSVKENNMEVMTHETMIYNCGLKTYKNSWTVVIWPLLEVKVSPPSKMNHVTRFLEIFCVSVTTVLTFYELTTVMRTVITYPQGFMYQNTENGFLEPIVCL